ncbi:MAG TPA: class I SAM-dependent methyltransferase [Polyangiaceae bacterium]|nr:class I SAM-dependent methyltransferase [Polyangiaceae bacterium]
MSISTGQLNAEGLVRLGRLLHGLGYHFTTPTPATHQLLNSRPGNQQARSVRDVFGWSRPFEARVLPEELFAAARDAGACEPLRGALWRPRVRFSSLNGHLFAHSAFPTTARSAVFFGPDSYRFVRAVEQHAVSAQRIVDVGCGSGVAGIALAKREVGAAPVVLADINDDALLLAGVNARLASVEAEVIHSDVLRNVSGQFDLVLANPPYLRDDAHRVYRDGGGTYGEQLALRITQEAIERLSAMPQGGRLLLYTGAAIVDGSDTFFRAVRPELTRSRVEYAYEELDPDVFSEELECPPYADVERIAAVFLRVHVAAR